MISQPCSLETINIKQQTSNFRTLAHREQSSFPIFCICLCVFPHHFNTLTKFWSERHLALVSNSPLDSSTLKGACPHILSGSQRIDSLYLQKRPPQNLGSLNFTRTMYRFIVFWKSFFFCSSEVCTKGIPPAPL